MTATADRAVARTGAALIFLLCTCVGALADTPRCSETEVQLRGGWGQAQFQVTIADEPDERAQGLMFVEEMPRSSGMLFVYQRAGAVVFWMKNTLIPLDMLFVDPQGVVRHIEHVATPGDLTPREGGADTIAVLEINGGLSRLMGIEVGSEMRHPAFDPALAVWPCDTAKN